MGELRAFIRLSREDFLILLWHGAVARSLDRRRPAEENWLVYRREQEVVEQRYYDRQGGVRRPGERVRMLYVQVEG